MVYIQQRLCNNRRRTGNKMVDAAVYIICDEQNSEKLQKFCISHSG